MQNDTGDLECHPYGEYIPPHAKVMIVGSFPIGKFTNDKRRKDIDCSKEVNFFYGGAGNVLWALLTESFNEHIDLLNRGAIESFLTKYHIAVGDVIKCCHRIDGSASDSKLTDIVFNKNLKHKLETNRIKTIIFTSIRVKEWFDKKIASLDDYSFYILLSPSKQGPRSIGKMPEFKKWKRINGGTATEFRKMETIKLLRMIF